MKARVCCCWLIGRYGVGRFGPEKTKKYRYEDIEIEQACWKKCREWRPKVEEGVREVNVE